MSTAKTKETDQSEYSDLDVASEPDAWRIHCCLGTFYQTEEILTLQFGPVSNFSGCHFWNIQEERYFQYSEQQQDPDSEDRPETDLNTIFHYSSGRKHVPRLVVFDFSSSFGHLVANPSLLRSQDKVGYLSALTDSVDTWNTSGMEVIFGSGVDSSLYSSWMGGFTPLAQDSIFGPLMNQQGETRRGRRDSDDEDEEEEGETKSLESGMRQHAPDDEEDLEMFSNLVTMDFEALLARRREEQGIPAAGGAGSESGSSGGSPALTYDQMQADLDSKEIRWSDFWKAKLHDRTLYELPCTTADSIDLVSQSHVAGRDLWDSKESLREDMINRARFFAEQCDYLQGIQAMVDIRDGFGAFAGGFLEQLKDDFGSNTTMLIYGMSRAPGLFKGVPYSLELMNESVAFNSLRQIADVYVPLSESRCMALPYLNAKKDLRFHRTALLGAMASMVSYPWMLNQGRIPMHMFVDSLLSYPANNVATASIGLPLGLRKADSLYDMFERMDYVHYTKALVELSLRRSREDPGFPYSMYVHGKGLMNTPLYEARSQQTSYQDQTMEAFRQVLGSRMSSLTRRQQREEEEERLRKNQHLLGCSTSEELFQRAVDKTRTYSTQMMMGSMPFHVPDSFPKFWGETVTPDGFVDATAQEQGQRVRSCAAMGVLKTSPRIAAYAKDLGGAVANGLRKRRIFDHSQDALFQVQEDLEAVRTNYES